MKMIILIVKDSDSDEITQALTSEKYRITRDCLHRRLPEERRSHPAAWRKG